MKAVIPEVALSRRRGDGLRRIETIMEILRGPGGCPWDREQTLEKLKPCLIEETYELIDAIDSGSLDDHLEELGDVLLQVVFQAQLRKEEGQFDLDGVAHAISDKLVRRHPHVFGEVEVGDSEEVLRNWEAIKKTERQSPDSATVRSVLAGVPTGLPALLRAQRVQSKCAKAGFDWTLLHEARAKVTEETAELDEAIAAGDTAAMQSELGDLLFAVSSLARFLHIDAEDALRAATARFSQRFAHVEQTAHSEGVDLTSLDVPELVQRWKTAKRALKDKADEKPHKKES